MAQPVLLLDDGELDDVQEILEEAGICYARVRGGAIVPNQPAPTTLLVSTPRRIQAVVETRGADDSSPVRIVVAQEDSPALRRQLRDIGFDFLVRRPVHHEALRLLLLHSVYSGEERRQDVRVPLGVEVAFKSGLFKRTGTLAELSSRGCRLLSEHALEPGKRIKIEVPRSLGAAEPLWIKGRVLRMSFDEYESGTGIYTAAVVFEDLPSEKHRELDWILQERSEGPPSLATVERQETAPVAEEDPGASEANLREVQVDATRDSRSEDYVPPPPGPAAPAEGEQPEPLAAADPEPQVTEAVELPPTVLDVPTPAPPGAPEERRRSARHAFDSKVPAFGSRALNVLMGRDLSQGGMRIERSTELTIGDRLHLAIYADPTEEPFLVWATVSRDDGERGMGLVFDELHPAVAEKLEKLVVTLPSVESLHDEEADAMGTVVSEILKS